MASIERHAPIHKAYSIDEWALRLGGRERDPAAAAALGRRLMEQIRADFDGALPCSVGVAPSRLLAKTACGMRKPNGLTVLTLNDLPAALEPLALDDLPGVGAGMTARLRAAGVHTPAQLWAISERRARDIWGGVPGRIFHRGLRGEDLDETPTRHRSVGHGHLLPPPYRTGPGAHAIAVRLLSKAAMRIRTSGHFAHRLHASVTLTSGVRWSAEIALPAVQDTPTLLGHFQRLWTRPDNPVHGVAAAGDAYGPADAALPDDPPRKVGVDLGGLTPAAATTGHLFAQADRPHRLSQVVDQVNRKHGAHALHFGAMTEVRTYAMEDKIVFGRIPEDDIAM